MHRYYWCKQLSSEAHYMSTKEHLITKVSEITFCPFCLMLIIWCSGIATSSCSSNIEGKGKVGKGSGTLLPPTLPVRQGNLLCILALVESLRRCFCVDAGCDTSVQIILGKKSNRRFQIEDASKTWPRIKLPPCCRPVWSRTALEAFHQTAAGRRPCRRLLPLLERWPELLHRLCRASCFLQLELMELTTAVSNMRFLRPQP